MGWRGTELPTLSRAAARALRIASCAARHQSSGSCSAQPGCGEQKGAGLAIDCLADGDPFVGERFTVTAAPAGPQNKGVFGEFFDGPATVSAIAVLSTNEGVTQVLQWSRIVILPEYPVPLSASAASQAEPK